MFKTTSLMASLLFLAACVTINIYFPAAEAQQAAEKIVDDILGDKAKTQDDESSMRVPPVGRDSAFNVLDLLIPKAEAAGQPKFDVDTPQLRKLQASMKQRHAALKAFYEQGAIGYTQDAMIGTRSLSAVSLKQRGQLKNLIAEENRDRNQLYREIARANGHPEWESDVRSVFAKTWVDKAAKGWWYQNSQGKWVQK
jgi:uncharacterized protein YdbL (DUF1318 family)